MSNVNFKIREYGIEVPGTEALFLHMVLSLYFFLSSSWTSQPLDKKNKASIPDTSI